MARDARWPIALLVAFIAWFVALGIRPHYREDWLLENVLVFLGVPLLAYAYGRLRFSNTVYTLLFVFFFLHEVGAHYTYSEVPYAAWLADAGVTLDADRNHFDRLVHFLYGLLIGPAAVELLDARAPSRGFWRWLLPILFMMSHSVLYELVEWLAAEVFGGDLGEAYLGTQGDTWDAQKDMALAAAGALVSVTAWTLRARPVRTRAA